MFPDPVKVVFVQYSIQALVALVIMLILRKFFRQYQNDFYLLWSWSWFALFINMLGSVVSLANAFLLPSENLFRLSVSAITVSASFVQLLWLYSGTIEISRTQKGNRIGRKRLSVVLILMSVFLVSLYANDPEGGGYRIFYRVGVKSLIAGLVFIYCAFLLKRISQTGLGIKFIIFSFLGYGLLQFNYFLGLFLAMNGVDYPLEVPYFMGAIDIFLQAVMGLGMIISVLEVEQHNLKKANSELDTFLYRSSHDLRAPLTTISGIVSAIKMTDDPVQKQEFMDAIQSRLEQADNVIRDIIALRKGQKTGLSIEEVDVLADIKAEYQKLTSPAGKYPSLTVESEGSTLVHTDRDRLRTVITNILSNAIKYHNYDQDEPEIQVKIWSKDRGLIIEFKDNGAGIDGKHLARIFEMFYRASSISQGTGLGLYLVKEALNNIQGKIDVVSQKGIGTTFTIYLYDHGANHSVE